MKTIARYIGMILIVGMLLGSTGCFLERYHDRHGQRDDRNMRWERGDSRDRGDPRDRNDRGSRADGNNRGNPDRLGEGGEHR